MGDQRSEPAATCSLPQRTNGGKTQLLEVWRTQESWETIPGESAERRTVIFCVRTQDEPSPPNLEDQRPRIVMTSELKWPHCLCWLALTCSTMSLKQSSPSFDPSPGCEAFYRALPVAPYDDASKISGNLTLEQKQLCANVLSYFIIEGNAFGCGIGKRIRLVEINVLRPREKGGHLRGRTVCEIQVERGNDFALAIAPPSRKLTSFLDMCNIYGVLHGGCAAYMIDSFVFSRFRPCPSNSNTSRLSCSSSSLVALGVAKGLDYSGMSQALNIIWHGPAPVYVSPYSGHRTTCLMITLWSSGTKLKIVSTSVVVGGRVMTARCEVSHWIPRLLRAVEFMCRCNCHSRFGTRIKE